MRDASIYLTTRIYNLERRWLPRVRQVDRFKLPTGDRYTILPNGYRSIYWNKTDRINDFWQNDENQMRDGSIYQTLDFSRNDNSHGLIRWIGPNILLTANRQSCPTGIDQSIDWYFNNSVADLYGCSNFRQRSLRNCQLEVKPKQASYVINCVEYSDIEQRTIN